MPSNRIKPMLLSLLIVFGCLSLWASDEDVGEPQVFYNENYQVRVLGSQKFRQEERVLSAAFLPGSEDFVALSESHTIIKYNINSGKVIFRKIIGPENTDAVLLSKDGMKAVCVLESAEIQVWDTNPPRKLKTLASKTKIRCSQIAFLPNGKLLLVDSAGRAHYYDYHNGEKQFTVKVCDASITSIAVVPDSTRAYLVSTPFPAAVGTTTQNRNAPLSDPTIYYVSLPEGEVGRYENESSQGVTYVACSSKFPNHFLSSTIDGTVKVWDESDHKKNTVYSIHKKGAGVIEFLNTKECVVSSTVTVSLRYSSNAHMSTEFKVWNYNTGKVSQTIETEIPAIQTLSVSGEDTYLLVVGNSGSLHVWNLKTGESLAPSKGHKYGVNQVAFSADGKNIISTGRTSRHRFWGGGAVNMNVWDARSGKHITTWDGSYYISQYASTIIKTGYDSKKERNLFHVFDSATGKVLRTMDRDIRMPTKIVLSPDGKRLLANDHEGILSLHDTDTATLLNAYQMDSGPVQHVEVCFTPDGDFVVYSQFNGGTMFMMNIRMASTAENKEVQKYMGHTNRVNAVVVSSDGKMVLSGAGDITATLDKQDYSVRIWDLQSGKQTHKFVGHDAPVRSVAFMADSTIVLSASDDGMIYFWDVEQSKLLKKIKNRIFTGRDNLAARINSLAVSPDGHSFAIANANGTICVYTKVK